MTYCIFSTRPLLEKWLIYVWKCLWTNRKQTFWHHLTTQSCRMTLSVKDIICFKLSVLRRLITQCNPVPEQRDDPVYNFRLEHFFLSFFSFTLSLFHTLFLFNLYLAFAPWFVKIHIKYFSSISILFTCLFLFVWRTGSPLVSILACYPSCGHFCHSLSLPMLIHHQSSNQSRIHFYKIISKFRHFTFREVHLKLSFANCEQWLFKPVLTKVARFIPHDASVIDCYTVYC